MKSLAIIWAQFGPYHLARVAGLRRAAGSTEVHAIELSNHTKDYAWRRTEDCSGLNTLIPGAATENLSFWKVFSRTRRVLADRQADVCLLPGYWPKQSFAALLAARSLGVRAVMMNETHAGTARASGWKAGLKRNLLRLFDAALVGGAPQSRYFAALRFAPETIFMGYDAVDNDYFALRADRHRATAYELRDSYRLPERYFLSLGRFVPKKNLRTLLFAYREYLNSDPSGKAHLVMVGSGPEETALKYLCHQHGLAVYEKAKAGKQEPGSGSQTPRPAEGTPGVHFYGFRQIEENTVFYALAQAFVLPSLREEWGLVVNEAMASGLPVVVSKTAGCSEDLLEVAGPNERFPKADGSDQPEPLLNQRLRRNGLVFDPESPEELANIFHFLGNCPGVCEAMGNQSRRIIERFSCLNFGRNAVLAARCALEPHGGVRQYRTSGTPAPDSQ